jgi:DNA primase
MRHEVINKVSARLGVARDDFANLLPKFQRDRSPNETPRAPAPAPPHEIALLCLLALRDDAARDFFLEQDWREVVAETPNATLLGKILAAAFRPDDSASLNLFLSSLPAEEESLVSGWLLQKMPPNAEKVAREWWQGLRQPALRRRLRAAESRLKLPHLTAGEVVALQKQVVDLRGQLDDFSRLVPSRGHDG